MEYWNVGILGRTSYFGYFYIKIETYSDKTHISMVPPFHYSNMGKVTMRSDLWITVKIK